MKFPNISEQSCETVDDDRCSDAAFAVANPGLCPNAARLVLKPETVIVCRGDAGTILFKAYLSQTTGETLLSGVTFASSNAALLSMNAGTGEATVLGAGIVTVSATKDGRTGFAQVTIMEGTDCCDGVVLGTVFVIDNSRSMGAAFGAGYPTRLDAAKKIAYHLARQLNTAKDLDAVESFHELPTTICPLTNVLGTTLTDPATTILGAIVSVSLQNRQTSLNLAFDRALEILDDTDLSKKAMVIISDGENRPPLGSQDLTDLIDKATAFRQAGGIVICVGIRATGDGFLLLRNLASGGFFINVLNSAGVLTAISSLAGLQCYYCGGTEPLADGYTCLTTPLGAQLPDPTPLAELEVAT